MEKNFDYVIKNFNYGGNVVDWLYCIKHFFGDEQTEKFCDYFINAHQIIRKNDIRNVIQHHSLSVYSCSDKEQLAFISTYIPIDTEHHLIKSIDNGLEKAQKMYRNKSIQLSKMIKKLGYSYSTTFANWKDKNIRDTYQREYIFIIYSENDNAEEFKNNIFKLAKECNIKSVLITDTLENKAPKLQIKSKLYNITTEDIIQEFEDTTIEIIEKYLSNLSNTKVIFQIPYEKNKTILYLEDKTIGDYYSISKQEIIKNARVHSMNMGMLKQGLVHSFFRENYNN